jgi:formylglycine-generating enzyme
MQTMLTDKTVTNSLNMSFVRIEAGHFRMGSEDELLSPALGPINCPAEHPLRGDYDERPAHRVTISRPFYMGVCEVTNAQYEQFDPAHRELRGKLGFSKANDEAVIFVSWHDAVRFCEWLSQKEGLPYRLPTEAEWEYACRAGTQSPFVTGDTLPVEYHKLNRIEKWKGPAWYPSARSEGCDCIVPLTVGQTPPNAWGLYDMHGNVEEWCLDWYGPYELGPQSDPVGRADGEYKVTRGGSHSTDLYFLRSASRMAMLPEDKHWLTGFRVVIGELPATKPLPPPAPARFQINVSQCAATWTDGCDAAKPYFRGPRRYVKIPPESRGPLYRRHNHDPGLCWCPNGDLLAIWYSCIDEPGRELCLAASRLRAGQDAWEPASPFWDTPDRNNHAPALWHDCAGTLYAFCGIGVGASWGNLALAMRTSKDNGATWSKPRLIETEHGLPQETSPDRMPIPSVFRALDGTIVLPSDAHGGSALYLSRDNGETWADAGGRIRGIHTGVTQLADGRLIAFGRGQDIDGHMPKSISADMGKTWTYSASPFPLLGLGQRLVLLRLKDGSLFFASFAGGVTLRYPGGYTRVTAGDPLAITDAAGRQRKVSGLFGALSFDDGETWPVRKVVTPDAPPEEHEITYLGRFTMDANTGEPLGYCAGCQTPDGIIHLITSQRHYAFNTAWLKEPMKGESTT